MNHRFTTMLFAILCGVLAVGGTTQAEEAKPSQYAPADDLANQLKYYLDRCEKSLADEKEYDAAKVRKDANTLAVIALVLSKHDAQTKFQNGALLRAAQQLAQSTEDFAATTKAFDAVKAAAAGSDEKAADIPWAKVASLGALMKQVPAVNSSLKRGLDPKKFAKQAEQSAGQAATLAAIAQAVMFDDEVAKDPTAMAQWQELCKEMRDSAAEINAAVHAADQSRAQAAVKRLVKNCDACHEKFRKSE